MSTGRNFDEILRALDSIQLTAKQKRCHSRQLETRRRRHHPDLRFRRRREKKYPQGWKTLKPYLRVVEQPK